MLSRTLAYTQKHLGRPWYPLLVSALAAIDVFIVIVPTDALAVMAVMAQPKRWIWIALVIALGSTLGVALLATILAIDPEYLRALLPSIFETAAWRDVSHFVQEYGFLAIFAGAVGPLPQQPFVVLGALGGMPLPELLASVLIGRSLKYLAFSWAASHAPALLHKFLDVKWDMDALKKSLK